MHQRRGTDTDEGNTSGSSPNRTLPEGPAPLVILSERGRHSDEARRIVRAQAARASAAQSRVTRARNREERESIVAERSGSLRTGNWIHYGAPSSHEPPANLTKDLIEQPLVIWLSQSTNAPVANLVRNVQLGQPAQLSGSPIASASTGTVATSFSEFLDPRQSAGDGRPQLPLATPRGFINLQQRVQISERLMLLASKAFCFDFDSPGVQERLQQLLVDQIIGYAGPNLDTLTLPGHPIQGHLRIACTCLTVLESQRAEGAVLGTENKYQRGLDAAWSEALLLDQSALQDSNAGDAALWAIFIINVTTGSSPSFFRPLLDSLLHNMQLDSWSQVRSRLVEFIYPASFLDEPCNEESWRTRCSLTERGPRRNVLADISC